MDESQPRSFVTQCVDVFSVPRASAWHDSTVAGFMKTKEGLLLSLALSVRNEEWSKLRLRRSALTGSYLVLLFALPSSLT